MSRLARLVLARWLSRLGREFPSDKALEQYLHEHPQADKSKHEVVKPGESKKPDETTPSKDDAQEPEKPEAKKTKAPSLFKADELKDLPEIIHQPIKDPNHLFEQAKEALGQQLDWLDRGKGLDKALGAKVIRGDEGVDVGEAMKEEMGQKGPIIVIGPLKKQERAAGKVDADYGGDWSKLGDIVRATVAVDSMDQIEDVMDKLRASGLKLARQPKDRFAKPTEAGYRDLLMNVVYPNGHIGEVQIHLKPILKAKAEGHKYYDDIRKIEETAKREGRTTMTDDETKKLEEANAKSAALYDKAWKEAGGAQAEPKTAAQRVLHRFAATTKYYDYDGHPAQWEKGKFPVIFMPHEKVMYELEKFFQTAQPIDKSAFEQLKKDQGK
jgi:hypothetical protein